jgi:hypothetical protein
MDIIYNAELLNNQIHWLEQKPVKLHKNKKYRIKVILEEKENNDLTGMEMINFFRNSPLFGSDLNLNRSSDFGRDIEL